jgi:DNA-binding GntR family transcriptional regulator
MPRELAEVLPKYLQIANYIRDRIIRGELPPGEAVPSERQIVADWGVSRPTAARVLQALRADGLVESRQGLGTVVTTPQFTRGSHERHVVIRRSGRIRSPNGRAEIRQSELVPAPADVRNVFSLSEADALALRRKRVSFDGDETPRSSSVTWLHPSIAQMEPRLATLEDLPDEVVTYVEQATGRTAKLYRERVLARLATDEDAADLALSQPAAVMVAYHTVFDSEGDVLSYELSTYPPGRVRYEDEVIFDPRER